MPPPTFNPPSSSTQGSTTVVTDSDHSLEDADDVPVDVLSRDPELRLRTVRTAASTIAQSIREEDRIRRQRKKTRQRLKNFFKGKGKSKESVGDDGERGKKKVKTPRRNVYVNVPLPSNERDARGEPLVRYVRNKVKTTSAYSSLLISLEWNAHINPSSFLCVSDG